MTRALLFAAAAMALTLSACGKKSDEAAMGARDANPAATVPTPANEAAAPDFVAKAGASDMFQIEAAKVALERSNNPKVRAFAQSMIDVHTQTTADLKKAIGDSGLALSPPTVLPDDRTTALGELRSASAESFDKLYMDGQVDGHQATLDVVTRYAQDGDNATLKAAAAAMAPVVQMHLDDAKAIRDGLK